MVEEWHLSVGKTVGTVGASVSLVSFALAIYGLSNMAFLS